MSRIIFIPNKDIGVSRNYQKAAHAHTAFWYACKGMHEKTDHSNPAKDDGSGSTEDEDHEYDKKN